MNKNMKHLKIFSLFLLIAVSCTRYLDIKPYGKAIPKTAEEFSAILQTHLYNIEKGEKNIIGNVTSVTDFECYADNIDANLTSYPQGNYIAHYIGANLSDKQHKYQQLYEIIRDCNIILENLKAEDDLAKDVKGTAYAIRGICYYNLIRDFAEPAIGNMQGAGVPLVLSFDMEKRPLRSTIQEIYNHIVSDFERAIALNIKDETYIFNNDILKGYLARVNFWCGQWDKAADYANEIITKYPLLEGKAYSDMIESYAAKKGNILIKSCTNFAESAQIYNAIVGYAKSRPASKFFVELFKEKEDDIRYKLSFNKKRIFEKYPLSCMRSAEMQLILAESKYHLGDRQAALYALNILRKKRITGVTDFTEATLPVVNPDSKFKVDAQGKNLTPLIYAILCERSKELFMEGDRWYELKRNGRPEFWVAKHGRKYTTLKFMYTFPLPVMDITLVKGLKQNPGYEKTE